MLQTSTYENETKIRNWVDYLSCYVRYHIILENIKKDANKPLSGSVSDYFCSAFKLTVIRVVVEWTVSSPVKSNVTQDTEALETWHS